MAINDVSLTSGMRSNLLSLQNTVNLLNRTQNRLSSGKKVNTAIDNPTSFFASQSLTSRASNIDSLKDAMSQAVSTINAADRGISAVSSMIEQAKGIAQAAMSADNTQDTVTLTLAGFTTGDYVTLDSVSLTAGTDFARGSTDAATAANLASAINGAAFTGDKYTAAVNGAVLTISKFDGTTGMNKNAAASEVVASAHGTAATVTAPPSELESMMAQYNTLRDQITALAKDSAYKGKDLLDDKTLTVQFEGTTLTVQGFDATSAGLGISGAGGTGGITSGLPDRTWTGSTVISLTPNQFSVPTGWTLTDDNDLMANPQNYRMVTATGVIVLLGLGNWSVLSGTISMGQAGTFEHYANGVNQITGAPNGVTANAGNSWLTPGGIEASITELDNAVSTLRQQSSKMSGNLSIITTRQDFSTNMINTLTEGSDKLTLADSNEEGANMLMLQTRQSLSTTALSLSSQAAQAVLRLFQ